MLNLALVGLLAGSLTVGGPDGDDKNKNRDKGSADQTQVEGQSVFARTDAPLSEASARTIQDTYAAGRKNAMTPLRVWAAYAQGEAEGVWDTSGNGDDVEITLYQPNGTPFFPAGDIVSRRAIAGAELGLPVSLFGFGISAGAEAVLAKNSLRCGDPLGPNVFGCDEAGDVAIESDFGLQNLKFYGQAQAGAVGVHVGYVLDMGDEAAEPGPGGLPTELSRSDHRDAINYGADFDYPSERFRLFGGVDYYDVKGRDGDDTDANQDLINWMFGAGVRFGFAELGAALQIQSALNSELSRNGPAPRIGGSAGTVAPYLKLSPPQIPASIFIKGAVQNEYTEFGYPLGGSNSIKPSIGFTAGLSFGFD